MVSGGDEEGMVIMMRCGNGMIRGCMIQQDNAVWST